MQVCLDVCFEVFMHGVHKCMVFIFERDENHRKQNKKNTYVKFRVKSLELKW